MNTKSVKEIMRLQIPQALAFIPVEDALFNSKELNVINEAEYQMAKHAIDLKTGGMSVDDWIIQEQGSIGNYSRVDFLKSEW